MINQPPLNSNNEAGITGQFGYIAKQLADLDSVLDLKRTALFSICFIAAQRRLSACRSALARKRRTAEMH
jgi:hypothetical protein